MPSSKISTSRGIFLVKSSIICLRLHPAFVFFISILLATTIAKTTPITSPTIIVQGVEAQQSVELSASQADWLAKLEEEEGANGSSTLRIIDTNNKFSTGCFMYQDRTFLDYGKKYGLVATSTEKAVPLIYNCELQRELAHKMLLDGGESHWTNSVKKMVTKYGEKYRNYPH